MKDRRHDASGVHAKLSAAAIELFDARGYDATSVNDVVSLAGLTKGAFYHYFSSKDDCLRELHKSFIEGELTRLEQSVAESTDPTDAIRRIIRSFLYGVQQHHALTRIFDQEWRHVEGEGFEEIRGKRDRIAEIVTEQFERGMASGVFERNEAPHVLALAVIGMCGWAHRWFQADGSMSWEAIADMWSAAFLSGILQRKTPSRGPR
jgi:AcrR family transcriptional regulator